MHDSPRAPPTSRWLIVLGISIGAGFALCGGCVAVLFYLGSQDEGGVRLSNEVSSRSQRYLREKRILNPGERIVAYYDASVAQDSTEAAVLTTNRILYHRHQRVTAIAVSEIEQVHRSDEGILGDSFEIAGHSGTHIRIMIAPMNGADLFHRTILSVWRPQPEVKPAAPDAVATPASAPLERRD